MHIQKSSVLFNFLSNCNNVCSLIPVLSTVTSIFEMVIKVGLLPYKTEDLIHNYLFTDIKEKSVLRCIVLLFPFIGNLVMVIYDFTSKSNREYYQALHAVRTDYAENKHLVTQTMLDNYLIVLTLVTKNGEDLRFASEKLKDNKTIVMRAIDQNKYAFEYASLSLRGDRTVASFAIDRFGENIKYASEELKNDYDMAIKAVKDSTALQCIGEDLKNDSVKIKKIIIQMFEYAEDLNIDESDDLETRWNRLGRNPNLEIYAKDKDITDVVKQLIDKNLKNTDLTKNKHESLSTIRRTLDNPF